MTHPGTTERDFPEANPPLKEKGPAQVAQHPDGGWLYMSRIEFEPPIIGPFPSRSEAVEHGESQGYQFPMPDNEPTTDRISIEWEVEVVQPELGCKRFLFVRRGHQIGPEITANNTGQVLEILKSSRDNLGGLWAQEIIEALEAATEPATPPLNPPEQNEAELKPCPFCGMNPGVYVMQDIGYAGVGYCSNCLARGPEIRKSNPEWESLTISAWNKRAG